MADSVRVIPPPTRRGVSLLFVLAALVLVIVVVGSMARIAAIDTMRTNRAADTQLADAMLFAADDVIIHWLEEASSTVVLSDDSTEPRVDMMHDSWRANERAFRIRITAWDQRGMAPINRLRTGSPWRAALPASVLDAVDSLAAASEPITGLDQFTSSSERPPHAMSVRVFPTGGAVAAIRFGHETSSSADQSSPLSPETSDIAIGAWIAPEHDHAPERVNINTMPIPLLDATLREAGRGGIEAIISARRFGKPAPLPTSSHNSGIASGSRERVQLTGASDRWAFRIDLTVDRITRSWWAVYQRHPNPSQRDTPWRRVQRLLIVESVS